MVTFTQQRHTYDFFRHRVYVIIPDIVATLRHILSQYPTLSTAVDIRKTICQIQASPQYYEHFSTTIGHRCSNISQSLHLGVQSLEQLCGLCGTPQFSRDHMKALWTYICRQIYELPTRIYNWSFAEMRSSLDQFLAEQTHLAADSTCPKTQSALRFRLLCLQAKLGGHCVDLYRGLQSTHTIEEFRTTMDRSVDVAVLSQIVTHLCETYLDVLGNIYPQKVQLGKLYTDVIGTLYHFLVVQVLPQCPGMYDPTVCSMQEIHAVRTSLESFVPQELSLGHVL